MSEAEKSAKPPIPSATILIVRDTPSGMEVFMVKRHHQIDFMANALVFPGGKTAKGDHDASLNEFMHGADGWSEDLRVAGAAAIREAFEESGILFAREAGHRDLISADRLATLEHYREPLEKGEIGLIDMLRKERLVIACDALVYFAHWITPANMPKRFDTHFFVAAAPPGHAGRHDGRESVDSIWIDPAEAVADRAKWNVVFPTKVNLMKLAKSSAVAEAMEAARAAPPVTVEPHVEKRPDGLYLTIPADAGYDQTSAVMRDALTPP